MRQTAIGVSSDPDRKFRHLAQVDGVAGQHRRIKFERAHYPGEARQLPFTRQWPHLDSYRVRFQQSKLWRTSGNNLAGAGEDNRAAQVADAAKSYQK